MTMTQRPESAPDSRETIDRKAEAPPTAFRIRYGRLSLALLGLLFLLTGVVSGVLRLFGLGSGWLPALTLLGAVGSVALLRTLAVRDRRSRVDAAFRSAMGAPAREAVPGPEERAAGLRTAGPVKESPLFDAEANVAPPKPVQKPLTAEELRRAALAEAAASGDTSLAPTGSSGPAEGTSWEPVEVPKPTYVEAPKAERAAPEPLDLPEAPKAVGKPSLKQAAVRQPETAPEAKPLGKGQSALSNLDVVLQRRRA